MGENIIIDEDDEEVALHQSDSINNERGDLYYIISVTRTRLLGVLENLYYTPMRNAGIDYM